jgi:RNA polymerase sigma-70 factor (ECF subfamily)
MHAVAVNSSRSTYRRLKNQAIASDAGPMEKPDPRTTSVIAGTRLDLLEAMESLERDHPQFVEPLLLRDVYGLPYDEIARLVDAPLGTVKAQIHHGRKLVRPMLRGDD